ncbi:unnamed protein product, partial [Mesorhabditis belari]|uniref:Uncharacterized protein n=1 Tax=Mesorhabditis belari TaxID=2138241 RepID=A0AAF3J798_9BILA
MRLFVADNEWANFCWQFLNVSKEFIIVGSKEEFSDANVTCIPISTCYDARFGFVFPLERQFFPSTKLLWSQFNKKRFRCEHQNESFEVLTQAVAVIGSDKYKEQSRQVNCSVSEKNLTFHASPLSLTLSCLNCNTTIDAPPDCQKCLQQVIQRCTNFNRNMRPMALEMLNELKLIDQKDPFIARLKFLPIVNESQTKILRPIGFDGTKNRIPVLEQKSKTRQCLESDHMEMFMNGSGTTRVLLSNIYAFKEIEMLFFSI